MRRNGAGGRTAVSPSLTGASPYATQALTHSEEDRHETDRSSATDMVVCDARDGGQWHPAGRSWAVSGQAGVRAGAVLLGVGGGRGAATVPARRVRDVAAVLPRLITGPAGERPRVAASSRRCGLLLLEAPGAVCESGRLRRGRRPHGRRPTPLRAGVDYPSRERDPYRLLRTYTESGPRLVPPLPRSKGWERQPWRSP